MKNALAQKYTNEDGFTLIELLVVVAIIGILSAIAIPSYFAPKKVISDATMKSNLFGLSMTVATHYDDRLGKVSPVNPSKFPEASVQDGSSWSIANEGHRYCISLWRDEAPDAPMIFENRDGACSYFGKTGEFLAQ